MQQHIVNLYTCAYPDNYTINFHLVQLKQDNEISTGVQLHPGVRGQLPVWIRVSLKRISDVSLLQLNLKTLQWNFNLQPTSMQRADGGSVQPLLFLSDACRTGVV